MHLESSRVSTVHKPCYFGERVLRYVLQTQAIGYVGAFMDVAMVQLDFLKYEILAVLTDSQFGVVGFFVLNLVVVLFAYYVFRLEKRDRVEIRIVQLLFKLCLSLCPDFFDFFWFDCWCRTVNL